MSKMDALRAMREANYARAAKGEKPATVRKPTLRAPAETVDTTETAPVDDASETSGEELCGHRNMGGRSCTREKGHTAKSHRYS